LHVDGNRLAFVEGGVRFLAGEEWFAVLLNAGADGDAGFFADQVAVNCCLEGNRCGLPGKVDLLFGQRAGAAVGAVLNLDNEHGVGG
jgi:hypothetical protein